MLSGLVAGQPVFNSTNPAWETLASGFDSGDADHRKEAIAACSTLGAMPRAVQMVRAKLLNDKNTLVRQSAADALGNMGSRDAIPDLQVALDDKQPEVFISAAKALWKLGERSTAMEIFEQILAGERKDQPNKLQQAIRDAKHKLKPEQLALIGASVVAGPAGPAVGAAKEVLELRGGPSGRAAVAEYLAEDSEPYTLSLLEWALGDRNWQVRSEAAKALGERGNRNTVSKLQPLLSDGRHTVRYTAAASILRLEKKENRTVGARALSTERPAR
jgi:HEAT repeat protein